MSELQHQLDVETIAVARPFEELLGLAIDTCLTDSVSFDMQLEKLEMAHKPNPLATVTQRLGLWVMREILEGSNDFGSQSSAAEDEGVDEAKSHPDLRQA